MPRFDTDKIFGIHEQAAVLRSRRAELLAANLINADTPGYKARDIDFASELKRVQGEQEADIIARTDARHLGGGEAGADGMDLLYRTPEQPAIDGNTVDAQQEKTQFSQNALQYQASLTFLSSKIRGLLSAIRGE